MTIIDATIRLVPGVLGDEDSSANDSFSAPRRWLECAEYTRPREYRGLEVPPVLLGGNHQEVDRWREENSRQRTPTPGPAANGDRDERRPTESELRINRNEKERS